MSISINLAKTTAVLAKYFAPIVSYEALKLDGNSSPINRYLRRNFCSNYKLFFQIIVNFSKNSEFDECSAKLPLQSSKQEQTLVLKQVIGNLAFLPLLLSVKERCINFATAKAKINLYK